MNRFLPEKVPDNGSDKNFRGLLIRYFNEEVVSKSQLTFKAKLGDLRKFVLYFEGLNKTSYANQWSPTDTKLFLLELDRQGYQPSSINRILSSLKSFGSWLQELGIVRLHPCKGIKEFRMEPLRPKSIGDQQYHRFKRVAESLNGKKALCYSQDFRNLVLLEILNASGLRIFELLGLKLNQFQGRKFVGVRCKNQKVRDVLIRKDAALLLQEYIKLHRTPGSDFLFTNRYGSKLSRNGIARALTKIANIAGANIAIGERPPLRPHLLRHRHAYKAREAKDPVFAAKRLGHSSLQYIERYSGLNEDQEEKILEEM